MSSWKGRCRSATTSLFGTSCARTTTFVDEYAAVKRRVGSTVANLDEYGRGKNAMVQKILAAAGLTETERASIDANRVPSHDEVPR